MDDTRGYTGWKAGLLVVLGVVVMTVAVNLVGNALRDDARPPAKIVETVTPSR